jgi:hypothetical protein
MRKTQMILKNHNRSYIKIRSIPDLQITDHETPLIFKSLKIKRSFKWQDTIFQWLFFGCMQILNFWFQKERNEDSFSKIEDLWNEIFFQLNLELGEFWLSSHYIICFRLVQNQSELKSQGFTNWKMRFCLCPFFL